MRPAADVESDLNAAQPLIAGHKSKARHPCALAAVFLVVALCAGWIGSVVKQSYDWGGWMRKYTSPVYFRADMLPDLTGKTAIITGGNKGIGRATALALAQRNATVVIAARDAKSGASVAAEIAAEARTSAGHVRYERLDLASLDSVKAFAQKWLATSEPVHMLVLNAGIAKSTFSAFNANDFSTTVDGFEETIGVNHLGHFLLVRLLEPRLRISAPARVISVASNAEWGSYDDGIRFDLWRKMGDDYNDGSAYGQSKLANILFAQGLANRLQDTGVTAYSCHPGIIRTDFAKTMEENIAKNVPLILKPLVYLSYLSYDLAAFNVHDGALTQLYLAASPDLDNRPDLNGRFFVPIAEPSQPQHPSVQRRDLVNDLWQHSDEAVRPWLA